MSNKVEVKLDIMAALMSDGKVRDNLLFIIRHERNISLIASRLGARREYIYRWRKGIQPRLPAYAALIGQYAEQLRQQLPASQPPSCQ